MTDNRIPAYRFLFALVFFLPILFLPPTWRLALRAQTTPIGGILNRYAAVSAIDTCSGGLAISDTAGFRAGEPVLLIQMQGAVINTSNAAQFGTVQTLNAAGRFERALVDSVAAGVVFLQNRLLHQYSPADKLQLVTFPRYDDATVVDTLRARPWDGTTGGILALDVTDTLTLDAPILADGAGFRGGAAFVAPTNNCTWLFSETDYYYGLGNWRGAPKGEGLAAFTPGRELGRGPQANGGGGANDHNAGGGGGANLSNGGSGGENNEPSTFGCDGFYPGLGGRGLPNATDRLVLGGGGGAGHANNTLFSNGGAGGGIILLRAGSIVGSNPVITANGRNAPTAQGDGAGGGGGGGTIWLEADGTVGNLEVQANGGRGGNTYNNNDNRCLGPGGGGGGGRILSNVPGVVPPPGGATGIITASTNGCLNAANGATSGAEGLVQAPPMPVPEGTVAFGAPEFLSAPASVSVCNGEAAIFSVLTNSGNWNFQWQINTGAGWQNLNDPGSYSGFNGDTLTVLAAALPQTGAQFRAVASRPGCYDEPSAEATLTVTNGATAAFSATPAGLSVSFSNQSANATSYFWDFGDGQTATAANPAHIYGTAGVYSVTLYAISPCDTAVATQTVSLLAAPVAGFNNPGEVTGCDSVLVVFENTSSAGATTFSWLFPGGSPATSTAANPGVTYFASGTYTAVLIAANAAGSDTVSQVFTVGLGTAPNVAFAFAANGNTVQFTNQSTGATFYTWNFGDNSSSNLPSPQHTYAQSATYIVTLTASGPCGTATASQTVSTLLPPTASFVVPDTVVGCITTGAALTLTNTSTGTAAFAWTFSGGATPAASTQANPTVVFPATGSYTAQLIATNAAGADTFSQTIYVELYAAPAADFDFMVQGTGTVSFVNLGSVPALSYTWDFGDGSPVVNGFDVMHQYAQSGIYTVTLIVANPCGAAVFQDNVAVTLVGTTAAPDATALRVYPNPTSGRVVVELATPAGLPREMRVYDAAGKLWSWEKTTSGLRTELGLTGLPAGIYQIWIRLDDGIITRAVVKH